MVLDRGCIDLVLVPCGLAIMFIYHLILLYRILYYPETTVVGYENHNKLAWVERMLKATADERSLALSVISSSTSASSNFASLSIALSSLIGTLVAGGSSADQLTAQVIYGDRSRSTTSVKYISLLICFLAAFTAFIQSARYFVHSSYLMTTPGSDLPVGYVQRAVIRGGNFWAAGLRAMYFATVLLMWVFGPIPMFFASVLMVGVMHLLDSNAMPLHRHGWKPETKMVGRIDDFGSC